MSKLGRAARVGDKRKGIHPRTIKEPEQPTKAKKVEPKNPKQFRRKSG